MINAFRGEYFYIFWNGNMQSKHPRDDASKKGIFIGELPKSSHDSRHQLYQEEHFHGLGFETERGWSEPYCDVRFNAIMQNR